MNLDINNPAVRFLFALVIFFLFDALIGALITDAQAAKIFKLVLIVICLLIVFSSAFVRI